MTAYDVGPFSTAWSGWTETAPDHDYVSQIITCNFDILDRVDLFAGTKGRGDDYRAGVWLDSTEVMRSKGTQIQNEGWVRFQNWDRQVAFTRGKQYEFRFTRSGSDSIQYYYRDGEPYEYGQLVLPYPHVSASPSRDLAMRVCGRLNPIGDVWRACVNHGNDPSGHNGDTALARAGAMRVRWLRETFYGMDTWTLNDTGMAMRVYRRDTAAGFRLVSILAYGSDTDTMGSSGQNDPVWLHRYPPRNLWATSDQTNYWALYCKRIMQYLPAVEYWEVWPEANSSTFLRDPDTAYYKGDTPGPNGDRWIDTWRERCSLYVRMCFVAESVARSLDDYTKGPRRRIIGGATYRLLDSDPTTMSGVDWLWNVFDLAKRRYGGVENCFDIVSVHPYMHYPGWRLDFIDDRFRQNLDTARWAMRQAGHPGMELWATEYGWPRWDKRTSNNVTDSLVQARNVGQFYLSAIASQTDPGGGYDRAIHYDLTGYHDAMTDIVDDEGFGLLDSSPRQRRLSHSWTFEQLHLLTGRRVNKRVLNDDTAIDNHTRMYEFEDTTALRKRTWVCWKNGGLGPGKVRTKLPVRTDRLVGESLAYSSRTPEFSPEVSDDGWLRLDLDERPVFITEIAGTSRPDLRVDSVRYKQAEPVVLAWVTNHGSATTPVRSGRRAYPTWAVLKVDGDSVAQAVWTKSIGINQGVEFGFELGRTELPDTVLLNVTVNPSQTFVELETDDNTGHTLKVGP